VSISASLYPIYYEYMAEICYPVPNSATSALLTMVWNLSSCIALGLQLSPSWTNLLLCVSAAVSLVCFFFLGENYQRLKHDAAFAVVAKDPTTGNNDRPLAS
jgi:hypothetical protein